MSRHIVPARVYFLIFLALLVLTGTTVWVAFLDLGVMNNVVALGIATLKAMLVVLYFMHMRYSSKLNWIYLAAGFLFLVILLSFTMSDMLTRNLISVPQAWSSLQ